MSSQDPNVGPIPQQNLVQTLLTKIVNVTKGIITASKVFANTFSTSILTGNNKERRIVITDLGIWAYDDTGLLTLFISNSVTNLNPLDPTVTIGSGFFTNAVVSLQTALTLSSKTGKAILSVSDGGNGILTFIGDNGSGNLELSISAAGGVSLLGSSAILKLNNTAASITSETLQKFVTVKDSSGATIKLGVVA